IIDQATKKFYTNDYYQFQNAEEKRKQMIDSGTSFVKGPEQNHPKAVYHARLLNNIVETANAIKNSRDSFNLTKPSAASEEILVPPEIQVEPLRPKNVRRRHYQKGNCSNCNTYRRYADTDKKICRLCSFAELFPKSKNQDINNFLIRSSNNKGKSILEWIPYEDFSNVEYIGKGGFSEVHKAMWSRGHIKHWNLITGEVVRSEPVEVALKVLDKSKDINSNFLNEDPKTENYIFVMQYANYGSLSELLANEFYNKENLDPEELQMAAKKRVEMIKSGIPFVEKFGFKHSKTNHEAEETDDFHEKID
ncbi:13009_t:CDS:2, partial [Acaulospora morrowiae]